MKALKKVAVLRRRTLSVAAVTTFVAGLLAVGGTVPAHAATGDFLQNQFSGKCMAVGAGSTVSGAGVIQWTCVGGAPEQLWRGVGPFYPNARSGIPYYEIVNVNSGKCFADPAGNLNHGVQLIQWDCYATPEQLWTESTYGTFTYFQNYESGLCAADGGDSPTDGAPIIQWECDLNNEQLWKAFNSF